MRPRKSMRGLLVRCDIEYPYLVSLEAAVTFTDCEARHEAPLKVTQCRLVYLETLAEIPEEVGDHEEVHCDDKECEHLDDFPVTSGDGACVVLTSWLCNLLEGTIKLCQVLPNQAIYSHQEGRVSL